MTQYSCGVLAKLNSCLEELRSIVGETTPEQQLIGACISCNYDVEKVINMVLNKQGMFAIYIFSQI